MHHLIQRGKVRSQTINVPEGLPELLSDITREVLRCQPTTECLCQFIIDYLHSVILTRDKAKIAKSIIDRALRIVDEVIADMCVCDIPKAKVEYMCETMEECFRRFLAQRRCEKKSKNKEIIKYKESDMLDELIKKCKFTADELKISRPVIEEAYQKFVDAYMTANKSIEGTDSLYQYFREREIKRMEDRLRAEAAVKIQSNFRGFLVRKSIFMDEPTNPPSPLPSETLNDLMQQDMAARKIQQFFRRRLSVLNASNVNEEKQLQNPCSPASQLSLTARPADHHDLNDEKEQTFENEPNENKTDKIVEKHDDENNKNGSEDQVGIAKTNEEVTLDADPTNDDVNENAQDY